MLWAVNCGGHKVLGASGIVYSADLNGASLATPSGNGATLDVAVKGIDDADLPIYRSERWSEVPFGCVST